MIRTVVKALEGFEKQFDELNEMKANLVAEKDIAIQEAIAEVDKKFAEKEIKIDRVLEVVSETYEEEVPDEVPCESTEFVVEENVCNEVVY